jgi:hypothetical protein
MNDRDKIRISHPELGESRVMPSALPVWLERGWSVVEGSAPPEVSSATASGLPVEDAAASRSDVTASRNLKKKTAPRVEES